MCHIHTEYYQWETRQRTLLLSHGDLALPSLKILCSTVINPSIAAAVRKQKYSTDFENLSYTDIPIKSADLHETFGRDGNMTQKESKERLLLAIDVDSARSILFERCQRSLLNILPVVKVDQSMQTNCSNSKIIRDTAIGMLNRPSSDSSRRKKLNTSRDQGNNLHSENNKVNNDTTMEGDSAVYHNNRSAAFSQCDSTCIIDFLIDFTEWLEPQDICQLSVTCVAWYTILHSCSEIWRRQQLLLNPLGRMRYQLDWKTTVVREVMMKRAILTNVQSDNTEATLTSRRKYDHLFTHTPIPIRSAARVYSDILFQSWLCANLSPDYLLRRVEHPPRDKKGVYLSTTSPHKNKYRSMFKVIPEIVISFRDGDNKTEENLNEMPLGTTISSQIDSKSASNFFLVQHGDLREISDFFREHYEEPNLPVILKGGCKHWPIYKILDGKFENLTDIQGHIRDNTAQSHPSVQLSADSLTVCSSNPVIFSEGRFQHLDGFTSVSDSNGRETKREKRGAELGEQEGLMRCETFQMTVGDYVRYAKEQKDERPIYMFDPDFAVSSNTKSITNDCHSSVSKRKSRMNAEAMYTVPHCFRRDDYFKVLDDKRPEYRWLIAGPKRAGSGFHIDPNFTSAWNACLTGRKRWLMFPPHLPPPGVYPSSDMSVVVSPVSLTEWLLNYYSNSVANLRNEGYECICEAGDIIFIPCGWWHFVINLDDSVAVTQNFVSRCNLSKVLIFLSHMQGSISGVGEDDDNAYHGTTKLNHDCDQLGESTSDILCAPRSESKQNHNALSNLRASDARKQHLYHLLVNGLESHDPVLIKEILEEQKKQEQIRKERRNRKTSFGVKRIEREGNWNEGDGTVELNNGSDEGFKFSF